MPRKLIFIEHEEPMPATKDDKKQDAPFDIDSLTLGQIKALAPLLAPFLGAGVPVSSAAAVTTYPIPLGTIVCVETVLGHYVGVLIGVSERTFTLEKAAWVPDTGRYNEFARGDEPKEVEPLPATTPVVIERGSVILARPHPKLLPEVK